MTQNGGFDFLIAWTTYLALLLVLAALIIGRRRR
jgi:hypothetical protein